MSLSKLPLPSIALVLTSNQIFVPTQPSVINVDKNTFPALPTIDLMQSIDYRGVDPLEGQHLSYVFRTGPVDDGRAPNSKRSREKANQDPASSIIAIVSNVIRKMIPAHLEHSPFRHHHQN